MLTDRTPEDYEAEINRLRDELEKAKNKIGGADHGHFGDRWKNDRAHDFRHRRNAFASQRGQYRRVR